MKTILETYKNADEFQAEFDRKARERRITYQEAVISLLYMIIRILFEMNQNVHGPYIRKIEPDEKKVKKAKF